jgi:hypothetical protein
VKKKGILVCLVVLLLFAVLIPATQAKQGRTNWEFKAALTALNGSGSTGDASLKITGNGNVLLVNVSMAGVTPRKAHRMAIQGWPDGTPAMFPPPAADTNGDGLISKAEAELYTGPVLLPLGPSAKTMKKSGKFVWQAKYSGAKLDPLDLGMAPLSTRAVVIYGGMVTPAYGMAFYDPDLPVACGLIHLSH